MTSRSDRHRSPVLFTGCLSILIHALVLLAVADVIRPPEPTSPSEKRTTTVPLLSDTQVQRLTQKKIRTNQRIKALAKKQRKKKKKRPKPPPRPKGQIVEIPPPLDSRPPVKARFLSEYNSRVDKEQVSRRKASPTPRVVKSDKRVISTGRDPLGRGDGRRSPPKTTVAKKRPPTKQPNGNAQRKGVKNASTANRKGAQKKRIAKVKPLPKGDGRFASVERNVDGGQRRPFGGSRLGAPPAPSNWKSLLPTMGPQDVARKSGSIDHVTDVPEGEGTFLNSREYRHAWFFNRIKRSVRQRWTAASTHRRYDPQGRIYGVRDRLTVVSVTLSPQGVLNDIEVKKDSGVAFLDEAAVEAFRAAQPFPNPPQELRDPDGMIRFQFGFFLEINGRGFRMFRSR